MSDDPFLYFDDTNPDLVFSNNQWFDNSDVSAALDLKGVFNDTLSSTTVLGATVKIPFRATQIAVVGATIALPGAQSNTGPVSSYVIDGSQNGAFLYQADVANATNVTFFLSGVLPQGEHVLQVTVLDATPQTPFLLDNVALAKPEGVATTTGQWVTTVFATPSAATVTPPSASNAGGSAAKPLPVGPIVGGVIAGIALLVAAGLAFYFFYWRKRHYGYRGFSRDALFDGELEKHHHLPPGVIRSPEHAVQVPFLAAPSSPQHMRYSDTPLAPEQPSAVAAVPGTGAPHTYPPPASGSADGRSASASGSGSGRTLSVANPEPAALTPAQRKTQDVRRDSRRISASRPVQFHADSGVRFDNEGRPIEPPGASGDGSRVADPPPLVDVPPEYSEL